MWTPIFSLPNIEIVDPIETDMSVLVSHNDPRCQEIEDRHPNFRKFLSFTDNFGRPVQPSVFMLFEEDEDRQFPAAWGASFRDAVSISMVSYNYTLALVFPGNQRKVWSDYLEIYPWMINRTYGDVVGQTHALLGYDEIAKFKGVSSPFIFHTQLTKDDYDIPLCEALLAKWKRHFVEKDDRWELVSLFRSLNMAFNASKLPGGREVSFLDIGRTLSLWVSAFEILAHPGSDGRVGREEVFTMFDKVNWLNRENAEKRFIVNVAKKEIPVNGASWLYNQIYTARNNFLHGNPVTEANLAIEGKFLPNFAGSLFRMALTSVLGIHFNEIAPSSQNIAEFVDYHSRRNDFLAPQNYTEGAIRKTFPSYSTSSFEISSIG